MKTNLLKLVLPAFAIILAVGLAFATEDSPVLQEAYYYHPISGWQTVMVGDNCTNIGEIPCTQDGYQLYDAPSFSGQALKKD